MQAPPPMPPPPMGMPRPAARHYNALAIVSICFAGSAFLGTWCLGGLIAVITGHIARSQIKRSGEAGDSLALAGLIIGYVAVALFFILIAAYVLFIVVAIAYSVAHPQPSPTPSPLQ